MTPSTLRADLRLVCSLVPEGSSVLDLGCGDGALLAALRDEHGCVVRGVEIDPVGVAAALRRGLSVVQADLDEGLAGYDDGSFDYVVLSQTLQVTRRPALVLAELMRVGSHAVVSFPNFGHWKVRARLALRGRMPVSAAIPYAWHDTPNIHHTTIKDFRDLVDACGGRIERLIALTGTAAAGPRRRVRVAPNLLADTAVALLERAESPGDELRG